MLLTCKSCGNTYVIDDAEWARPDADGKICEQCQEPLVPLIAGGAQQDSTTILEGYSFDGLQSSWRAQHGGAVDAAPAEPPSFGPGGWDESANPMQGGWNEHAGSMSASVPLPPESASMARPPPTGGYTAPPGAGAPPHAGGYAPPPAYPRGAGHGGAPMPPPTQALDPVGPGGPGEAGPDGLYIGSNERTMALDIDNLRGNAGPPAGAGGAMPPPTQALDPVGPGGHGAVAAPKTGELDTSSLRSRGKKQVIIGGGGARPPAHEDRTAAIDLSQASAYAAQMQNGGAAGGAQPQAQFRPRPVPGMMHPHQQAMPQSGGGGALKTVLIIFVVLLLLGGAATAAYFVFGGAGDDDRSSKAATGGDDAPAAFTDRLAASRATTSGIMLPTIAGEIPEDGQIVMVSPGEGLFVEDTLLVPFSGGVAPADQLDKGLFMPALSTALAEADPMLPIVVLLDATLRVEAAFPVLYTALASGRRVLIGGSTIENPASVGTLELNPWQWPAPPSGDFATPTKQTELRIAIDTSAAKLHGKQVNPDGDNPDLLTVDLLALTKLPAALASAKGATSDLDAVRFAPAPELTVGKFIEIVQIVRGEEYAFPRFGTLYLEPPAAAP